MSVHETSDTVPSGEPWAWSAVETATAVRSGAVSAREVAKSVLDRIDRVNPELNALPMVLRDEALAVADAVDERRAAGEDLGPLAGVPVVTKLNTDHAGTATTNGVVANQDATQSEDAGVVAALRAADSTFVGRSNVPAFSIRWFSDNDLHGRTLNPWDAARTPGGSSGGSAAAVASGMCAIGQGNDMGGSIRYPAYACGIVGLRPSPGLVSSFQPGEQGDRGIGPQLMSVEGPLARSVADCRLAFEAMLARDPRDVTQVPAPAYARGAAADGGVEGGATKRVALFADIPGVKLAPSVASALESAAAALTDAGYLVEEAAPPRFAEGVQLWRSLLHNDLRRDLEFIKREGDDALRANLGHMFAGIEDVDRDGFLAELARRHRILVELGAFFAEYPVVLLPVSAQPPFLLDADAGTRDQFEDVVSAQAPLLYGACLGLPGLSVPTGVVDGLPTGVQLMGPRYREDLLFGAGTAIERALGRITLT